MYKLITPYAEDFSGKNATLNVTIKHFPDTESYVRIPQINSLKAKRVTIYHRLYPEPEKRLFELLLTLSEIKSKTKSIELFVPYLPYARQDRANRSGEAVSADVLCKLLKDHGVKKLITYDCHFLSRPGNFVRQGLTIENRSAGPQLLTYAKKYFSKEKNEFVVISPDEGSSYFTENAEGHSLTKTRKQVSATGEKTGIHAPVAKIEGHADVEKNVRGKNVVILDDIIATGGTIMHAAKHLKSLGARKIIVGATHGVFAGETIAKKILARSCSHVFVTNSILQKNNRPSLGIISIKQSI